MTEQFIPTPEVAEDEFGSYEDYWGFDEKKKHYLPDGKQYFEIQVMNEGQRTAYQKMVNSDLTVSRTGDAKIKVDPAQERQSLIKASVVGAHIVYKGSLRQFDSMLMENWLDKAPVRLVDDLEAAIRKANPWLSGELTVAQIEEQIQTLQEQLVEAKKREAGK
jgi:hypothetical protein